MFSRAQFAAFGRHVITWSSGAVAGLEGAHILTQAQGDSLSGAIGQIASGVTSIAGGLATLMGFASAGYAMWTASKASQITAVNAANNGVKVVSATSPSAQVNEPIKTGVQK